jgi:hypothetical protein
VKFVYDESGGGGYNDDAKLIPKAAITDRIGLKTLPPFEWAKCKPTRLPVV